MDYTGSRLTGPVELDGNGFIECEFEDAVLIYRGGEPPLIQGSTFGRFTVEFKDAAGSTLALMAAMARPQSGMRHLIAKTCLQILGEVEEIT